MYKLFFKIKIISLFISISLICPAFNVMASDEEKKETETGGIKKDSLMERIDFGNSYILGQSIKSGAVYLLHRKKSKIKSMLETRENYREEILEDFKVRNKDKDEKKDEDKDKS